MSPRRVLVVDDERPILRATVEMLRELGYVSEGVGEVDQIVRVAAEFRPHAILQDVRMPGLDLPMVVAALRSMDSDVAIVLFSAGMEVEDFARDLGVRFMEKPFKPEALVAAVDGMAGVAR